MDIKKLYRQLIMDHYKSPRNKGLIKDDKYITVAMNNPSCGDEITIQVDIQDNIVHEVRHDGSGCSICCSSASVLSQLLKNKNTNDALEIIQTFYKLMQGEKIDKPEILQDAVVYEGVSLFPARIKCATLAWIAVEQAINSKEEEAN